MGFAGFFVSFCGAGGFFLARGVAKIILCVEGPLKSLVDFTEVEMFLLVGKSAAFGSSFPLLACESHETVLFLGVGIVDVIAVFSVRLTKAQLRNAKDYVTGLVEVTMLA